MSGRTGNVPTLGGWLVVALLGAGVFILLRQTFGFYDLSAALFGLAAALILLMLLTGPAPADDADADRVRKIVPAPEMLPPMTRPEVSPSRAAASQRTAATEAPKADAAPRPVAGPLRLTAPREGKADDLKEIEGVGPAMEMLVNSLGFYHFDQIAGWSDADVAAVDGEMQGFKGRIARDRWVAQARIIVTEGLEAFRERAKTNNY